MPSVSTLSMSGSHPQKFQQFIYICNIILFFYYLAFFNVLYRFNYRRSIQLFKRWLTELVVTAAVTIGVVPVSEAVVAEDRSNVAPTSAGVETVSGPVEEEAAAVDTMETEEEEEAAVDTNDSKIKLLLDKLNLYFR